MESILQEQKKADGALAPLAHSVGIESETLIAAILGQTDDCVKLLGMDGVLEFMNCNGMVAMEIPDFAAVSGRFWWDLWPDGQRDRLKTMFQRAQAGHECQFTAFCPTAMGTPKSWQIRLSPMTTQGGIVVGVLCSSREVTELT